MPRTGILAALIAGALLAVGSAIWFRAALNESFARGVLAGRSEVQDRIRLESDRLRAEGERALAQSNRDVLSLELAHDKLREQLDELVATIHKNGDAGPVCLGPDVVRALARIGGHALPDPPRP